MFVSLLFMFNSITFAAITVNIDCMKDILLIGEMIRFHRKRAGLTQKELADLAGTGKTVVYDLEKGKRSVQLITLEKILHALNIKISFTSPLMDVSNNKNHEKSQGIR